MESYELKSYAQEGEDILLKRIFEYRKIEDGGFYVDIGAHHPLRFSNTYFFYKRNWRGINVDATPKSMELFNEIRPLDINLECAISNKEETLDYYMFNEPALNSFDKALSQEREKIPQYNIIDIKKIQTQSIASMLDNHLPKNQTIDFLTIDIEGFDLEALQSNNWEKYRPNVILIEILGSNINDILNSQTYSYLTGLDYVYYSKTVNTNIFIDTSFYNENIKG